MNEITPEQIERLRRAAGQRGKTGTYVLLDDLAALLADRDHWQERALAAEERVDGQAWEEVAGEVQRLREGLEALMAEPEFHANVAFGGNDYVRTRLRALLGGDQ